MFYITIIFSAGPKQWGKFFPVCGSGKSQSPIDLPENLVVLYEAGAPFFGPINFSPAHLSESMKGKLKNNGHSGKYE